MRVMILFLGALVAAACQSSAPQTPAVLASPNSVDQLKSTLAEAMQTNHVELGASDPTASSAISVLPRRPSPYEDRSTAMPTRFDIVLRGERCFVLRHDTGEAYELAGVACRPLTP